MNARRIDPSIIKIKERAHIHGVIDSFIGPPRALDCVNVFAADLIRRAIDFLDECEERFIFIRKRRGSKVFKHRLYEFAIFQ